jgi:hypothetical protein
MRYLVLIYEEPPAEAPDPDFTEAMLAEYAAFTRDVRERGAFEGGEALQPVTTATTGRVRDGQVLTTDGPFAETKEHLGGFYLLECRDLDEAIELAARIPGARWGSIEIRPIWETAGDEAQMEGREAAHAS